MIKVEMIRKEDISTFCNDITEKGTVVGLEPFYSLSTGYLPMVKPLHLCKHKRPFGILLNDVVKLDMQRGTLINLVSNEVIKGGKVSVMVAGIFITDNFSKDSKPEIGRHVYVDTRNSKFTTRLHKYTTNRIGMIKGIDSDGCIEVEINI